MRLVAKNNLLSDTTKRLHYSDESIIIDPAVITNSPENAYVLRVRIEYFQDLSAKMTISQQFSENGDAFQCIDGPLALDVRDSGLVAGDFTSFYYSVAPVAADVAVGDGSVMALKNGTAEAYFANLLTRGLTYP